MTYCIVLLAKVRVFMESNRDVRILHKVSFFISKLLVTKVQKLLFFDICDPRSRDDFV